MCAAPPNGLELSCPAARATADPFSRILAGKASPTSHTPAGSAAARGCVKTPNSPIAFPLRPQEPGEHTRIAPTSCFPQCHSWGWHPTGPSFHAVWRVVMLPSAGDLDSAARPLPSLSPPTRPSREPPSFSGKSPAPGSPTCEPLSPFRMTARGALAGKPRSNLWTRLDATAHLSTR